MGLCEKCMLYDKNFDTLCQSYDDTIQRDVHHCKMFDSFIPENIYSGKSDCPYCVAQDEGTDDG